MRREIEEFVIGVAEKQREIVNHMARVRTYRDTGSVESGLEPIFGSVSGSENQISGIWCDDEDTFCLCYRYILWFIRYRTCNFWFWFADPYCLYRS